MLKNINTVKYLGVVWAVLGLTLLFIFSIIRIITYSFDSLSSDLSVGQGAILLSWSGFMLYTEGFRGFQKKFSPRFASRALYLFNNPRTHHLILAPMFCMGYIHATRKRKLSAWLLTLGIIVLVVGVRQIAQPWRGIIDTGVIVGLVYGLLSVYYFVMCVMRSQKYIVDPEVT